MPTAVVRKMLGYSLPNHVANLAWQAPTWLLPLLVIGVLGARDTAYFYVAWTIAWSLGALPTGVSLSLTAEGSFDEDRLVDHLKQAARGLAALVLPAVAVLVVSADMVLLPFGEGYAENAAPALRLLVLAAVPSCVTYLYTAVRRVEKRLGGIVGLTAFVAAATLLGSYVLANEFGLIGVAYAWLGAQSVGAAFAAVHLWRMVAETKPTSLPAPARRDARERC